MEMPLCITNVFLMQIFGFSVNLLTLLAVVLSVGLVVDDAIIVGENVFSYNRRGITGLKGSILGAQEVANPVIFAMNYRFTEGKERIVLDVVQH